MNLLIIGATGLVGNNLVSLLQKDNLGIKKICFIASKKSRNKLIYFNKKYYFIKTINDINFSNYTHACLLTSSTISKQITPSLLFNHIIVIDNSSAYRNFYNLTIPEINFKKNKNIYINPNCCVIQSVIPLFYIDKSYHINKIILNTYQSCSGGGYSLLQQLENNTINYCNPIIGEILKNNNTSEEQKIVNETLKILNKNVEIFANCVRVPTKIGHLVNIIFEANNCTKENIYDILSKKTRYIDHLQNVDLQGNFHIYTTKLKQLNNNTFSFYTYANNLLRGASYNTFLILQHIQENNK